MILTFAVGCLDLDDPLPAPSSAGAAPAVSHDEEKIANIVDMGFTPAQARKALRLNVSDQLRPEGDSADNCVHQIREKTQHGLLAGYSKTRTTPEIPQLLKSTQEQDPQNYLALPPYLPTIDSKLSSLTKVLRCIPVTTSRMCGRERRRDGSCSMMRKSLVPRWEHRVQRS